ncbi:4-coumarate--CoA ligase [Sorochytrium milnesiophthora]
MSSTHRSSDFTSRLRPLASLIGDAVAKHDQTATAVFDASTKRALTYGQLMQYVGKTAAGLQSMGLAHGDVVAVVAPNDITYPAVLLAANLAGIVASPINPLLTTHELQPLLQDCAPKVIFTTRLLLGNISKASDKKCPVVLLDGNAPDANVISLEQLMSKGGKLQPVNVKASDTAFLCFSRSKAVQLTHANIAANLIQLLDGDFQHMHRPGDIMDLVMPMFHIYGLVCALYMGIYLGNTIVILPRFDLKQYLQLIQDYRVTLATLTPPVILSLAKDPAVDQFDLSSLRSIVCAAAPLSAALQEACMKRLNVTLRQAYGMTEMSPISHLCREAEVYTSLGSVGTLVPFMESKVLDKNGQPAKVGEPGELYCRGPNVMTGYLNNIKATEECLSKDGWLRTGDIAVVDRHGHYHIVDRVKELIKYKGNQVPPAELEAVLLQHPDVADTAVIGVPSEEAGELPRAFVVLKKKLSDPRACEQKQQELVEFVAARVAPYKKLRGGVELVDVIPKSASGKLLRRLLRAKL